MNKTIKFALAFIGGFAALDVSADTRNSPVISSLVIESQGALPENRIRDLLGVKVGDKFSEASLDNGLKRLANTGRYQGLQLQFDPLRGRLLLDVKLFDVLQDVQINFFEEEIAESLRDLLRKDIVEISSLAIGDQVSVDALPEIRGRIETRLKARGFHRSQVVLALQEGEKRYDRVLLVDIKLNTQDVVQALRFVGFRSADLDELRSLLERAVYTKPYLKSLDTPNDLINNPEEYFLERIRRLRNADKGKAVQFDLEFPADQALLSGTLTAWGKRMRQEGYFDFDIQSQIVELKSKKVLEIVLNRGQKYDIQFTGNTNFWERELRRIVLDRPIRLGIPFNLNDAKNAIRSKYLADGFIDVQLESEVSSSEDRRVVSLDVNEGKQYFLGDLVWEGVSAKEKKALSEIESRWKDSMSHPFHYTYFDEKNVRSQLPLLLSMLKAEGYLQSRFLGFSYVKPAAEAGNRIDIKIPLQLGPQFKIRSLVVENIQEIEQIMKLKPLPFSVGEIASSEKILEASESLKREARENGFLLASTPATVDEIVNYSDTTDEVDLVFRLTHGPKIRMGQIVPEGLRKTKEKVILREFERENMTTGDVWVPSKLERIDERLLAYGLFNNLRMQSSDPRAITNDSDSEEDVEIQERDLRIVLSERPGGAVEFGPGYRTDLGVVAFGELNYRNLGGMNRSVVLRGQVSRKIENYLFPEQRYSLSLLEPYTFGVALASRLSLVYEKRDDRQFDTFGNPEDGFNIEEVSISLGLSREIYEKLTLKLNTYTLSVPRIFDLVVAGSTVERLRYRIATIGPELEWDDRDNIFNPTKGILVQTSLEYSGPSIGSGEGVHFLLNKNELSYYKTLRRNLVFASSVSFSHMRALGGVEGIPENRRLVLGGRTTIRSLGERKLRFDQSGVGLMNSGLLKLELRQGIFGEVGVAYFFDLGRVDASNFEGEGWRESAGVGLRYQTPVGPLALDFAFNMDKRTGEDFQRILFSVGVF